MVLNENSNPLIIEIAGLAGVGKTTLTQMLSKKSEKVLVGTQMELRHYKCLPIFLSHSPYLLQVLFRQQKLGRRFRWDEIKYMVYLKGWPGLLRQQIKNSDKAILLDHGGIFKLATLYAFGPEKLKSSELKNWWNEMYQEWASTLNLVIWLDASEEVLLERINHRNQRHAVKGKPELEAHEFLECYRMAYRRIFQMLNSYHEQRLLSFDTNRTSIEEIADAVLLASGLGHRN